MTASVVAPKLTTAQKKVLALIDDGWTIHEAYIGFFAHGARATKDGERHISLRQPTLDKLTQIGVLKRKPHLVDGRARGFLYARAAI